MRSKVKRFAAIVAVPIAAFLGGLSLATLGLPGRTVPVRGTQAEKEGSASALAVPMTWNDAAMATLEVPLANPNGSPKHVLGDYYYKIRVRPIYKSYPIYAPGHEPPGYVEWLKRQEPLIVWDDAGHRPPLQTQAEWIKAGEMVFDSPLFYEQLVSADEARDPQWYDKIDPPLTHDGVMPFCRYVIRKQGQVEVGAFGCGTCHMRVMADESILRGAQGNFAVERAEGYRFRHRLPPEAVHGLVHALYIAPWLKPDPNSRLDQMGVEEIASSLDAIPAGVMARGRTSPFFPVQIPDLIGVKDRHYLDRTGLQQHGGVVDLMRYSALNQGMDDLASFDGFIPRGGPHFDRLPIAQQAPFTRYSDEQLYALALYLYSLEPPPNPNKFDALAAHGQKIFEREGCQMCHTPPLYTNNKLTPAQGFTAPPDHFKRYDILPISVGTDPNLTMKTRRGTGYYKVPSLKGVWYRSMFGHSGWCATLEDWFDPGRTRDDYVPTGFKPYGAKTYRVKGHPFGLDLSEEDRKALIAFLKTL
jgi:hypothetical protein